MEQEKKKLHIPTLVWGSAWLVLGVLYACFMKPSNDSLTWAKWLIVLCFAIQGVPRIVQAFRGGPKQPTPDPRPFKVRLREEMQDYDEDRLRSIVDDKLRGAEVREVAQALLEEKTAQSSF